LRWACQLTLVPESYKQKSCNSLHIYWQPSTFYYKCCTTLFASENHQSKHLYIFIYNILLPLNIIWYHSNLPWHLHLVQLCNESWHTLSQNSNFINHTTKYHPLNSSFHYAIILIILQTCFDFHAPKFYTHIHIFPILTSS